MSTNSLPEIAAALSWAIGLAERGVAAQAMHVIAMARGDERHPEHKILALTEARLAQRQDQLKALRTLATAQDGGDVFDPRWELVSAYERLAEFYSERGRNADAARISEDRDRELATLTPLDLDDDSEACQTPT